MRYDTCIWCGHPQKVHIGLKCYGVQCMAGINCRTKHIVACTAASVLVLALAFFAGRAF